VPTIHCPAGHPIELPADARLMYRDNGTRESVVHACPACRIQFLHNPDGSVEPLRAQPVSDTAPI
jgi:hypothetical protein